MKTEDEIHRELRRKLEEKLDAAEKSSAGMCSSCSGDKLCQCQHWRPPGINHRGEKCEWCKDGACPSCQGCGGSADWVARAT
jgi:hypothetical protein